MSVQITLKMVDLFSSVIKFDDEIEFDLKSIEFVECLEEISEKTNGKDENGNHWYKCPIDDADRVLQDALNYECENDLRNEDFISDANNYFNISNDWRDFDDNPHIEIWWKIS